MIELAQRGGAVMKLNSDCVRAILLTVEKHTDFNTPFQYDKDDFDYPLLKKYSYDEIVYHIKQCELSNLIFGVHYFDGGNNVVISDLSPEGHQFIANIREDKVWKGVKTVACKVGSTSLSAITQIASGVVSELIKAYFTANPI